jgi:hypothetical protein
MNDRDEAPEAAGSDPRLTEEMRQALARVRAAESAARAAGRWKTTPVRRGDRFGGPFGVDKDGNALVYDSVEEAELAHEERRRRSEPPVEEGTGRGDDARRQGS